MQTNLRPRKSWLALVMGVALLAAVLSACGSSDGSSSSSESTSTSASANEDCSTTPGVTADTIKVGALMSVANTGNTFEGVVPAIKARFQAANEAGGVNGRMFEFTGVADDQVTPDGNVQAAKQLVERDEDFGIVEFSFIDPPSAPYLSKEEVPVTGLAITPVWVTSENMFGFNGFIRGAEANKEGTRMEQVWAQYLYERGKKLASFTINVPASVESLEAVDQAFEELGGEVVSTATVPLGSTDLTADVQKAQDAGADVYFSSLGEPGHVALATQIAQAGGEPKAVVLGGAWYGPKALKESGAALGKVHAVAFDFVEPVESGSPATQEYSEALEKAGVVPNVNAYPQQGWVSAGLLIKGVEEAGSCPTRKGVIDALNKAGNWTAEEMYPRPIDFTSLREKGRNSDCAYFAEVNEAGTELVIDKKAAPLCLDPEAPTTG